MAEYRKVVRGGLAQAKKEVTRLESESERMAIERYSFWLLLQQHKKQQHHARHNKTKQKQKPPKKKEKQLISPLKDVNLFRPKLVSSELVALRSLRSLYLGANHLISSMEFLSSDLFHQLAHEPHL